MPFGRVPPLCRVTGVHACPSPQRCRPLSKKSCLFWFQRFNRGSSPSVRFASEPFSLERNAPTSLIKRPISCIAYKVLRGRVLVSGEEGVPPRGRPRLVLLRLLHPPSWRRKVLRCNRVTVDAPSISLYTFVAKFHLHPNPDASTKHPLRSRHQQTEKGRTGQVTR